MWKKASIGTGLKAVLSPLAGKIIGCSLVAGYSANAQVPATGDTTQIRLNGYTGWINGVEYVYNNGSTIFTVTVDTVRLKFNAVNGWSDDTCFSYWPLT